MSINDWIKSKGWHLNLRPSVQAAGSLVPPDQDKLGYPRVQTCPLQKALRKRLNKARTGRSANFKFQAQGMEMRERGAKGSLPAPGAGHPGTAQPNSATPATSQGHRPPPRGPRQVPIALL